ncbi:MAG: hypothetical protein ACH36H_09150 [Candidatus Nanopelagicales bacterium]
MSAWFSAGSALFMAGAIMSMIGRGPADATFAIGAVFFTTAAFIQWRAAVSHLPRWRASHPSKHRAWSSPDWLAAVVQLVGTLEFNVMTIRGMSIAVTNTQAYDHGVWRPDVLGSALFLISSLIALHPMNRGLRHALVRGRSAAIVSLNLAGSAFFGISAIAALGMGGGVANNALNNLGTLLGGACFLVASAMLWPPPKAGAVAGQPDSPAA